MKTLFNLFNYPHRPNPTANIPQISGGGNSHRSIFTFLTVTLLLLTLAVGDVWAWATRTYDGSTKLYILNIAPSGWSDNWSKGDDCQLYVCLKPESGSETWYTPTLESGSAKYARGALYSITPPSGTYEYVKLKRASGVNETGTNTTNGIDFSSTSSNNFLKGYDTSTSTGTWDAINPTSVTSDGTGVLYFNMSPGNPTYIDYDFVAEKNYAFFFNNDHGEWSDQAVQVTGNYYKVHVPNGTWSGVILTRHGNVDSPSWDNVYTTNDGKKNQSTDITFTDNHNYISAWYENKYAGSISATMSDYVPASTYVLNGSMNDWNMMTAKYFDEGTVNLPLPAHKTYAFKIIEGGAGGSGTWYGLTNANCIVSTMGLWTCNSGDDGKNIPINTAGEGTYTFEYNESHQLSVTYPTVSHPNKDYVYLRAYSDWANPHVHFEGSSSSGVAGTSGGGQQLKGLSSPSTITNTVTFTINSSDEEYYYCAVGEYPQVNLHNNDNHANESGNKDVQLSKRLYWKDNTDGWIWDGIPVHIGINELTATTHVVPNYLDVAFNSAVLTDLTTVPQKTNYTFGGFYTGYNDETEQVTGNQVIDEDGKWKPSVENYTDELKHWIHPGCSTTLYAKWTEDTHTVSVVVSPSAAGSVQANEVTITELTGIGFATHSPVLTAVPSNAAWVFKEWQVSDDTKLHLELTDYTTTGTTMEITATGEGQTLTAVFVKRYELVGSVYDGSTNGGMPGWNYDGTGDFTINSFDAVDTENGVDLSYSCSLTANTAYKLRINDRGASAVYGKIDPTYDYYTLPANTSAELSDYGDGSEDVWIQTGDASGLFTFRITKMRNAGEGNRYYPTLSVDRPQQINYGWKYTNIDGSPTDGNVGGTVAVTKKSDASAVSNGTWLPYGTIVTYTASPTSGYTVNWHTKSDYSDDSFSSSYTFDHNGTFTGNGFAKFIENATTVTLSATNGKIQIGGEDKTSTTCGVTTTRTLTAVPNDGYKFASWTETDKTDYSTSSTSTATITLSGLGGGLTTGQTLTANFTERYTIKGTMNGETWNVDHIVSNISTNASGDVIGYVDISLPANTSYEFAIYDLLESQWLRNGSDKVYYMSNGNSYNWGFGTDKTHNCGITTAGAGTYRFMWNITDKTMSVIYPNFVIYRTGDKDEDTESTTHTITNSVESYAGGTINAGIEFRMKVRTINQWYTLCLPFTVSAVKVWDNEDEQYYDIVPYYRTGGKFYSGHYVIRTPETPTGLEIENFDNWIDPSSADDKPSINTPYIIQWANDYFQDKYVSFFSGTGQEIPTSMTVGDIPSTNTVVNVYGNNSMTTGTVPGAYMLEPDYGEGGAWLRGESASTLRTILPFECFIRASDAITAQFQVIRRGMKIEETATGFHDVLNSDTKSHIAVYTLSGVLMAQYENCSFAEVARRLRAGQHNGLFILRAENESVKLMIGGK